MLYDLVSFDIFDTLVHRKLRAPVDVFDAVRLKVFESDISLVNHDTLAHFPADRIRAESLAREQRIQAHGGEGEISFEEIYDTYEKLTGCPSELRECLMTVESEMERQFLVRSLEGHQRFNELREQARHLALVSDMYHSSAWLEDLLTRLGFDLRGVPIFVSSEYRASKGSGAMYDVVRKHFDLQKRARWLHVGDNLHADIAQASRKGAQTVTANWARVDNVYRPTKGVGGAHLADSIAQFLELPQAIPNLPKGDFESLGYRIFGPLVFGYLAWIYARCLDDRIERALFVARDGWLPHQLFDAYKAKVGLGHVSTEYVYGSRQIGVHVGSKGWDCEITWWHIGGRAQRPVRRTLESIGVDAEANRARIERAGFSLDLPPPNDRHRDLFDLANSLFREALAASQQRRDAVGSYYDDLIGSGSRIAIVDIGWNGNMQRLLLQCCRTYIDPSTVHGYVVATLSGAAANLERGLNLTGWLANSGQPAHVEQALTSGGVELLEFALTADHGSAIALERSPTGEIRPVLEGEHLEAEYRAAAMRVQTGIRAFVRDHAYLFDIYRPATICTTGWAEPFQRLVTKPTASEARLLCALSHSDMIGRNSSRTSLAERLHWTSRLSPRSVRRARNRAFWKAGFDAINSF